MFLANRAIVLETSFRLRKKPKATLAYSENISPNVVLSCAWLKHFKKRKVTKETGNFIDNQYMNNEVIVNEMIIYETTVHKRTMLKKCFIIIDDYSSHCSVEFFEFDGDHTVDLIYFYPYSTLFLHPLDIGMFEPLTNIYCQELDEWAMSGNQTPI